MSIESNPVQGLVPLLFVDDIEDSIAFYTDRLGFVSSMKWEPEGKIMWCRLERGSAALMLQPACPEEDGVREERIKGVGFFFFCDDAKLMYEEFSANGLDLEPPRVAFYGMNQLFLKDPDGYELCFQNQV
ncbi:VOC family protein [Gimesia algae]|uniref:Glyoxalase-like domain protein n=1 Tax=Gimesia algae TaxID=2527971 RepID=A0A517VBK0_9PLAN|nr:VOC family protein [Gimesia algae]QDT90382.1 Glyoxalase-like domain protein [Gimesia algae]